VLARLPIFVPAAALLMRSQTIFESVRCISKNRAEREEIPNIERLGRCDNLERLPLKRGAEWIKEDYASGTAPIDLTTKFSN
jgi:hypothetical protein